MVGRIGSTKDHHKVFHLNRSEKEGITGIEAVRVGISMLIRIP